MARILLIPILVAFFISGCTQSQQSSNPPAEETNLQKNPKQMLRDAYQLFKEGKDDESVKLAQEVLEIGKETNNDTLIGRALTSMCRNAQRSLDTTRLAELSDKLVKLSKSSGDEQWLMYRAHMNAEMWRLIGDMDRAEMHYNESLRLSESLGAKGMYTIDHFNKSFVSTAKGDYTSANDLIKRYYQLRFEADSLNEDAYGLIALAYLLEQQNNLNGAAEVAAVARRLFEEQNIFPEPPDEKPLKAVEARIEKELEEEAVEEIVGQSVNENVRSLLAKYLE
jgi:tetratricopeptide (TPR) repeat protein